MTLGPIIQKSLWIWLLIIAVETAHGALRQIFIVPIAGDFTARQISVFTGSVLIFLITCFSIRWINPPNRNASLLIGMIWVLLTFCFEVGLGIFAFGYANQRILEDYDLLRGGFMGIGLVIMFFSPLAAARIRIRRDEEFRRTSVKSH